MALASYAAGFSQRGSLGKWAIMALVCLLVLAVLGGLKYRQIKEAIAFGESFPERSEAVTAVLTSPESWPQTYRTIGEVRATKSIELRTEVGGKVAAIGFVGGSPVEEGQQLLLLDSTEERAQLRATRAQLKLAELQLERLRELRRNNLASQNEYDSAEADKDILLATAAALAAIIEKKSLVAPFDAQTGLHTLEVGQYLAANTVVTQLTGGLGEVWIDFKLPQGKAGLAIGDTVTLDSSSLGNEPMYATIISAESSLNTSSRSREFRALLREPPITIRPGAVVDVEVVVGSLDGVFRLPASAVRRNNFGAFVYVLNDAEPGAIAPFRASRRQVTVGPAQGEDILVTAGLEPGERVATIGAFKLIDGLLTHVVEREQNSGQAPAIAPQPGIEGQPGP